MEIEWFNYVEELKKNYLELTGPLNKECQNEFFYQKRNRRKQNKRNL